MGKLLHSAKLFLASIGAMLFGALTTYMHRQGLILGAVSLPNGSIIAIASGYATSKTMSAVTNANPGVATLEASHGVVLGDFLEVTSGWTRLTNRIVRAGTVSTNDVQLEGINTTSTSLFPAGSGTGSVREITGWTQLSQITSSSSSGGEQQFLDYQLLEADSQTRIPTFKSPAVITLSVAYDPNLAGYQLAKTANDDRAPRAVRITLSNGSLLLYNAYISLGTIPTLTVNELMTVEVTLALLSEPVRYAS